MGFTNIDMIQSMKIAELTEFLCSNAFCPPTHLDDCSVEPEETYKCLKCIEEYLKDEYKEY